MAQYRPSSVRPVVSPVRLALQALLALLLVGGLVACRASATPRADASVAIAVAPEHPAAGPAEITVHLTRNGLPVDDAAIQVIGDMTHAGMVPVRVEAKPMGSGRYVTHDFHFTMPGDWIITAEATLAGGEQARGTLRVTGVAGGDAEHGHDADAHGS